MDNEHEHLQKDMKILEMVLSEEEGGYERVATENGWVAGEASRANGGSCWKWRVK